MFSRYSSDSTDYAPIFAAANTNAGTQRLPLDCHGMSIDWIGLSFLGGSWLGSKDDHESRVGNVLCRLRLRALLGLCFLSFGGVWPKSFDCCNEIRVI